MSSATIHVTGYGATRALPDEVVMRFTIARLRQTPEEALRETAERSRILDELLDQMGIAGAARHSSGIAVDEQTRYEDDEEHFVGYQAKNVVTVRFTDPSLIGPLMRQAVERTGASVHGPSWEIKHDNPARLEACRLAAAEARRKAQAYAEALGGRLGAVVEAHEGSVSRGSSYLADFATYSMPSPAHGPAEITVSAGELDIVTSLSAVFRIDQ